MGHTQSACLFSPLLAVTLKHCTQLSCTCIASRHVHGCQMYCWLVHASLKCIADWCMHCCEMLCWLSEVVLAVNCIAGCPMYCGRGLCDIQMFFLFTRPQGKPRLSDACLQSQGCHLIPLSYLFSSFSTWSLYQFCLVNHLLRVHSPDFFPENSEKRVGLFCMALVEQLGDDSW